VHEKRRLGIPSKPSCSVCENLGSGVAVVDRFELPNRFEILDLSDLPVLSGKRGVSELLGLVESGTWSIMPPECDTGGWHEPGWYNTKRPELDWPEGFHGVDALDAR
jgi:hypothetical protein